MDWHYDPNGTEYIDQNREKGSYLGNIHDGVDGMTIAIIVSDFVPNARENGYLMAASRAMYKALKLYQEHQLGTGGHYCWECNGAINKAIAHAEGKGK